MLLLHHINVDFNVVFISRFLEALSEEYLNYCALECRGREIMRDLCINWFRVICFKNFTVPRFEMLSKTV